ncbi:MAG: hypothetical protein PHY43_06055 [Verrucomicrobiales bacterium]|nr:hypothetical protein [Verrucomicrobiales bacterium]
MKNQIAIEKGTEDFVFQQPQLESNMNHKTIPSRLTLINHVSTLLFRARSIIAAVSLLAVASLLISTADADQMLTGGYDSAYNDAQNWVNGTIGAYIQVGTNDITVTALGFDDFGQDGFVVPHTVGIFADDIPRTLLGSVTLSAGTADPLVGEWRFATLATPITLTAGQKYLLGASTATDDGDKWMYGPTPPDVSTNWTYAFASAAQDRPVHVYKNNGAFVGPDDFGGAGLSSYALNMQFTPKAATAMMLSGGYDSAYNDAQNWVNGTIGAYIQIGVDDITVTELGFNDFGRDGFVVPHTVGIFADDGPRTLLGSVTISAGAVNPLIDEWRFATLATPITLTAGQKYFLGASTATDDGDKWMYGPTPPDVSTNWTYAFAAAPQDRPVHVYKNNGAFVGPDDFGGSGLTSYALNFRYVPPPPPPIMSLTKNGPNEFFLSWTLPDAGFSELQTSSNLTSWSSSSLINNAVVVGDTKRIVLTQADLSNPHTYFRLIKHFANQLQVLLPGETAAPNTPGGKTGVPVAQISGIPFNVVINACDQNWNVVSSVTDTINLTAYYGSPLLPADFSLSNGTSTQEVTFYDSGSFNVIASDVTDPAKTSSLSADVTVNP